MAHERFPLTIVGEHPEFQWNVQLAHNLMTELAESLRCPPVEITAVLADDIMAAIHTADPDTGWDTGREATPERIGGTLAAKNIPTTQDGSTVEIIFDAALWQTNASQDARPHARRLWIAVHEFMHPLFGRLRHASGALDGVPYPSQTPREVARSMIRVAIEEMRCDQLADLVLQKTFTMTTPDGQPMPMRLGMLHDLGYCHAVLDALDEQVYPGWPDIVEAFRASEITLEEMWQRLVDGTSGVVNLLARAQAEAKSVDYPGPLCCEAADHPATHLYLRAMWDHVLATATSQPVVPRLDEFAELEAVLLDQGEAAILDMWRALDVEVEELGGRDFALWVTEPARGPHTADPRAV